MKRYLLIAICLLLAACGATDAARIAASPQDRALAEQVIASVQSGDVRTMPAIHPELAAKLTPLMPRIRAAMPSGGATRHTLVRADISTNIVTGGRTSKLSYEIANGTRYALFTVGIYFADGKTWVTAVNAIPLPEPLAQMNRFTWVDRTPLHYVISLAAIASIGTIVAALIVLVRTPGIRRKWLWGIGCCVAIGQVAINWSTGEIYFNPLFIQIFGAMAVKPGVGMPWLVGFGFPLVAIFLLIQRDALIAPVEDISAAQQ